MKAIALAVLALAMLGPARAADYRFLSTWDKSYPAVPGMADPFIKNLEAATQGRIKLIVSGPEAVSPYEQLEPVSAGVFQFLFTAGAYHYGTTPFLSAVEALGGTPESRVTAGVLDVVDRHYEKYGLKLIALAMENDGSYNIFVKQPIGPSGDLQGRKIRSSATYHSVLKLLGASPVGMPAGEVYSALEKGVVDGGAWPVRGLLGYRWYEVAKYLVRPAFGWVATPLFMNRAAFNRLPEADRRVVLEEGRKAAEGWQRESSRLAAEEEKALLGKGMAITYMGDAQRAKLKEVWSDGVWESALRSSKTRADIEQLRSFAVSKGLSN